MDTPGRRFREALKEEKPLQVIGTICAYHALLAKRTGYKAVYLSGGGVAAGSLGMPDLGISGLEDVLIDSMRGRSSTWTRIRVNLRNVPEALRPPQETPDPDDDPTREWRKMVNSKW